MSHTLVIGGGIVGMLTARELAEAGERVTLIEMGETGRESTWAGGGIVSPLYPWRYPEPVTALAAWSQAAYPALCADLYTQTGIDPELTRSGLLILDTDECDQAIAWAERHGVELGDPGRGCSARDRTRAGTRALGGPVAPSNRPGPQPAARQGGPASARRPRGPARARRGPGAANRWA